MVFDNGYWVKFEVQRVQPTPEMPHGLRYSLTLHNSKGKRVLGYDNAHPVTTGSGPGARTSKTSDHRHVGKRKMPYPYSTAGDLIEAFWRDVDRYRQEKGI